VEPSIVSGKISVDERTQLAQTAQMFEAIVANQPDDYQTLETLEETYLALGQGADALRTAKRAAKAYINSGLISKAILAYEGIVQRSPDDAEATAALKELSSRMAKPAVETGSEGVGASTPATQTAAASRARAKTQVEPPREDPNVTLGKFLANLNLVTARQLDPLYQELQKNESNTAGQVPAVCLIELLQERGLTRSEDLLELLVDKFHLPYLPLQYYDLDADIVRALPRDLCFRHLVVPFDRISRTFLLSTPNPYVRPHFAALAEKLDLRFQWYLNSPQEIKTTLQNVYRLDRSGSKED
jgi:hypothetical protein